MTAIDITLILYQRSSKFEVMNAVYTDLYHGFIDLGLKPNVVEIKDPQLDASPFAPDFPLQRIDADELDDLLNDNCQFLTDDHHSTIRLLGGSKRKIDNLTTWVTYFYGQKFIFEQYRNLPYALSYRERLKHSVVGLMPPLFSMKGARWYVGGLARTQILAQSLWTGLLLNRVYMLKCSGVIYIPVDPAHYDFSLDNQRALKCLIFFGNNYDTDLKQLSDTVGLIQTIVPNIEFEAFGNYDQAALFEENTDIQIRFHNAVDRRRLSEIYNSCLFTICSVYNGNFEKVPIESLLTGTPVISYLQPFMEVTGETSLVANIQNAGEVRSKVLKWVNNDLSLEKRRLKERILSFMGHRKVANDFIMHLTDFTQE